jgi:diadenosine tetraphosphate (Ap4A) HIT family hydrolase
MSASTGNDCPFCGIPPERVVASNAFAFVIEDAFPVSLGHSLIIPRRHTECLFDLTAEEAAGLYDLLCQARLRLDQIRQPVGYNVGGNVGAAAGQTVPHAHLHLLPRYAGDVSDPEGGVRNVIPGKGKYLLPPTAPPKQS